jgi:putative transposase
MESTIVRRVYRFRLEPTTEQERHLRRFAGARRFIWNWALEQRQEHYRRTGKTLSAKELSARLTAIKDEAETAWLQERELSTSGMRACDSSPWDTRRG